MLGLRVDVGPSSPSEPERRTPMLERTDLVNRDGQLMAVVEVKTRRRTSTDWAAQLRRNLLAHGYFPRARYFLLVTPDRLYLWKGNGTQPKVVQPTYEIDARPIFAPYFERAGMDPQEVSGPAFELVVAAWLSDLVQSEASPETLEPAPDQLRDSGILEAVRAGRVEYGMAA